MKNTESTTGFSKSKFAIVRAISIILNLGDDGKMESFLTKVIRTLEKEIVVFKKNFDVLKFNYEQELQEFQEKLEDAEASFQDSLLEIDPVRIKTNEQQTAYVETYLSNIDNKTLAIKSIEKRSLQLTEVFEKAKKEIQDNIASLEKRIKAVSEN
jgi:ABC-type Zn2+ transport system substrate-binding protein/surface adhesin